jgi:molecular chaperone Hsp33
MTHNDSIHKFLFDGLPVRGEFVRLDATWQAALERVDYPPAVRALLGEALAATVLLGSTLKFDGALTLQVTGDGPVHLLVVQVDGERHVRGLARWTGATDGRDWRALLGGGRLVITIEQRAKAERYQGIVELEGDSFAAALEAYFARSEQLPTRLFLAADGACAAGLLLQAVPGAAPDDEAWRRVTLLGETVTAPELLALAAPELLHRLYHEEAVRLLEAAPVAFRCSCSRQRIAEMLQGLGEAETLGIVAERGEVEVDCEFCGRRYRFDPIDAAALFARAPAAEPSTTRQ